jgi:(p)ppGpp synthase/HD superfamily hydrolase
MEMIMRKGELLGKVIVLATNAHAGQFDRGGNPYILHPMKVMHYLKSDDEELQCIALLHDVVEDTDTTWRDLIDIGCTDRIIDAVKALTKVPGQTYEEYQIEVLLNADAMKVKLCDLRHNTDIRRLKGVTQKDIDRIAKYNRFYLQLHAALK